MHQQVLGVIPARFGSTRFPGKMLATLHGKSLIQYTYENSRKSTLFERLIVATDDSRIYDTVLHFGGEVMMTPTTCQSGTERIAALLRSHTELSSYSIILNIQGDEPLAEVSLFESLIETLEKDPKADVATPVTSLINQEEVMSPNCVKCVTDREGYALYFSRAVIPSNKKGAYDPKTRYLHHLGLYAYRPRFLNLISQKESTFLQQTEDLEQLKFLEWGFKIKTVTVSSQSFGVDTPEDLERLRGKL